MVFLQVTRNCWLMCCSETCRTLRNILSKNCQRVILQPGDFKSDVGDKLVALAKTYVTVHTVCVGTIPVLLVSGASFFLVPNPVSALPAS